MKIQFKDIAHFYIGCECSHRLLRKTHNLNCGNIESWDINDYQPMLFLIEDITDEHLAELNLILGLPVDDFQDGDVRVKKEAIKMWSRDIRLPMKAFVFLIKNGYDMFGLIDSKQAINKNILL